MEFHIVVYILIQLLETRDHELLFNESSYRAAIRFETLARVYYLRHSFEYCDTFLAFFLSMLSKLTFQAMDADPTLVEDEDRRKVARSSLVLAVKGLEQQGCHAYISLVLARMIRNMLDPESIAILASLSGQEGSESQGLELPQPVRSEWPMAIIKGEEDLGKWRLSQLVKQYEKAEESDEDVRH